MDWIISASIVLALCWLVGQFIWLLTHPGKGLDRFD
jgi:hypothetical protein